MKLTTLLSGLLLLTALACTEVTETTAAGTQAGGEESAEKTEELEKRMVEVEGGPFVFGATEKQFEILVSQSRFNFPGMVESLRKMTVIPPRQVDVDPFLIDQFEVTNEQFSRFLKATGYAPEKAGFYLRHWESRSRYPDWAASFPVVWVSREDAEAYCNWRGDRLPTEEEWAKAARGPDGRAFPWGDEIPELETANFTSESLEPIGNRPGDRSVYDVYDLSGNAAEFTASSDSMDGEEYVVVRGGSYNGGLQQAMTFYRYLGFGPHDRNESTGFRCASDP